MWGEVDVGGESGHFQVGGSERVFWFWQGSWVHRVRESEACWMLGIWLFGKVIIKFAVGSSKCGGNWIMECCMTLRLLRFVQGQLMVLLCLKEAGESEDANLGFRIDLVKYHFLKARHAKT